MAGVFNLSSTDATLILLVLIIIIWKMIPNKEENLDMLVKHSESGGSELGRIYVKLHFFTFHIKYNVSSGRKFTYKFWILN